MQKQICLFFLFIQILTAFHREKFDAFNEWINGLDIPYLRVELKYLDAKHGYGLFAKQDIVNEDFYLSVPLNALISDQLVYDNEIGQKIMKQIQFVDHKQKSQFFPNYEDVDNYIQILIFLMIDSKNDGSFWKPYYDMLPQNFDNLPFNCDECLKELKNLQIVNDIDLQYELYYEFWSYLEELQIKKPELFDKSIFNYRHYLWASQILNSRLIHIEEKSYLIPILDMANCAQNSNQKPHTTLFDESKQYTLTLTKENIKKGQQITENYAQKNSEYLIYHGFTQKHNAYDCFDAEFTIYDNNTPDLEDKLQKVRKIFENEEFQNEKQVFCLGLSNPQDKDLHLLVKVMLNTQSDYKANLFIRDQLTLHQQKLPTYHQDLDYIRELHSQQKEGIKIKDVLIQSIKYRAFQRNILDLLVKNYTNLLEKSPEHYQQNDAKKVDL